MTTPMTPLFVNTDEPCRGCRGKGGHTDPADALYGTPAVFTPCNFCGGSGCQSIMVGPPMGEPRNHGEEIANARAGFGK